MKIPLTVALLTYNRAHYLQACIDAILAQTFSDFELLILDNGSSDETPSIILGNKDKRIRYIRNPPGHSAYFNGICALQIARGKRIIQTHDDDIMEPTMLAREMAIMDQNPEITAVWTNVKTIDNTGNIIQERLISSTDDIIYNKGEFIARFPFENPWPPPSTLMYERSKFPKDVIKKWYYDRGLGKKPTNTHGGDDIIIPAIMNSFGSVAFISTPLLRYRKHENQDTFRVKISKPILNTYKTLRKLAKKIALDKETISTYDLHIAKFSAQHLITQNPSKNINKNTKKRIISLNKKTSKYINNNYDTSLIRIPIEILSHQINKKKNLICKSPKKPQPWDTNSTHAFFYWAQTKKQGGNIFSSIPTNSKIVILGSAMVSALLINEAREQGLNVIACIDSNITRQNEMMLGIPIYSPEWLSSQGTAVDYVILSSERDQETYLCDFIRSLNNSVKTLSWKDLAMKKKYSESLKSAP